MLSSLYSLFELLKRLRETVSPEEWDTGAYPRAKVILHAEETIIGQINVFRDYQRLVIGEDPYFNPNLSYDYTVPTLKIDNKS